MRPPLIITGPPAAGKTSCGRALAQARSRAAYLDVDDLRQLVVAGAEAPWRGAEGAAQHALGAANAVALAQGFRRAGFEVVITDVLTPALLAVYRGGLPDALVVRLRISLDQAVARARNRPQHLTDAEFVLLHRAERADPPAADVELDVEGSSAAEQRARLEDIWAERVRAAG